MAKKKSGMEPSFEESLAEVEKSVAALEGGELSLDQSLKQYEQAIGQLRRCNDLLEAAENRIELVEKTDNEGKLSTTSFDATATTGEPDSTRARSKKRTSGKKPARTKSAKREESTQTPLDETERLF